MSKHNKPLTYLLTAIWCCLSPNCLSAQTTTEVNSAPASASDHEEPVDPLQAIRQIQKQMSQLDKDFADGQTSKRVQLRQQEIIQTMQAMLSQQSKSEQSTKSRTQSETPRQKPQPEETDSPGRTSKQDDRTVQGELKPRSSDPIMTQKLQEQIWGHLPDRLRDRVRNVDGDSFLPRYERLIRAYYERLANEATDD